MPHTRTPRPIVSGRHPIAVAFLASCLTVGLALVLVGTRPRSVTSAMPTWVQVGWEAGLIIGGAAGLLGVLVPWRDPVTGLMVERFAMIAGGTAMVMYAIALFVINGTAALASGLMVAAFAIGSLVRVAQISRDLKMIAAVIEAIHHEGEADT